MDRRKGKEPKELPPMPNVNLNDTLLCSRCGGVVSRKTGRMKKKEGQRRCVCDKLERERAALRGQTMIDRYGNLSDDPERVEDLKDTLNRENEDEDEDEDEGGTFNVSLFKKGKSSEDLTLLMKLYTGNETAVLFFIYFMYSSKYFNFDDDRLERELEEYHSNYEYPTISKLGEQWSEYDSYDDHMHNLFYIYCLAVNSTMKGNEKIDYDTISDITKRTECVVESLPNDQSFENYFFDLIEMLPEEVSVPNNYVDLFELVADKRALDRIDAESRENIRDTIGELDRASNIIEDAFRN